MLNICRLWTTRHFPISAAGRALDHQSIHLLTSTTASPLTILSTKNFTTISKSKRRAGSSSRWVHCTSAFPSQTQMTRRSSRSSRLSSRRSVSRMNPPTATRISMPQGWSSMDRLNRCRRWPLMKLITAARFYISIFWLTGPSCLGNIVAKSCICTTQAWVYSCRGWEINQSVYL